MTAALIALSLFAAPNPEPSSVMPTPLPQKESKAQKDKRMAWWREARFGMFIHWGVYSVPAGEWNGKNVPGAAEWLMYSAQIPVKDYQPLKAQFNPVKFDAKRWVQIAKAAGMKYIVITSKHHDGFAMFDSKLTDWGIMHTPFHRDPMKELAAACKAAGIKLCFYHSIMDWTHPDYGLRRRWDPRPETPTNMDRYVKYMKGQLKELLTNYGDIGILWFDGEWEPEAWNHERGVDLYNYVRKLQPKIIINNRVDVHRSGMQGMSSAEEAVGDYGTPEQEIPANGMPGADWESCMTMNDTWGFHKNDHNWKSAVDLVHNVIDCASKGGNYLLNVGPTSLGEIPEASVQRLAEMGSWRQQNGVGIYESQAGPFPRAQAWGRATRKGNKLYCFVFDPSLKSIHLSGLQTKVVKAYRLVDKKPVAFARTDGGWLLTNPEPKIFIREPMPETFVVEFAGPISATVPVTGPDRNGVVILGAQDAETKGSAHFEGAADKKCIGFWTGVNDTVTWKFTAPAGRYAVEIEWACDTESAGSVVRYDIGGTHFDVTVPGTGSWSTFQTKSVASVNLKGGKGALTIRALSKPGLAVMNLRSVLLRPYRL